MPRVEPPASQRLPLSATAKLLLAIGLSTLAAAALSFGMISGAGGTPHAFQDSTVFWTLFRKEEPAAGALSILLVLFGIAGATFFPAPVFAFVDRIGRRPAPLIATFGAGAAVFACLVYRAYPLCMDEYAPWFQAKAFAAGRLTGQVPAGMVGRIVPGFRDWFLETSADGRVASSYWPGFALLLTPFTWLGVPWLLNPLIGAASLALLSHLSRRLLPERTWGWVLLLAVSSPVFLVDAISFYSMSAHLLFSLLFMALLIEPIDARRAAAAGVVGSFALVLHNPVPHALFALPWIVWIARRPRKRHLVPLLLGYLPLSLLLGVGWMTVRASLGAATPGANPAVSISRLASHLAQIAFALPDEGLVLSRIAGLVKLILWAAPGLIALATVGGFLVLRNRTADPSPLRLLSLSASLTFVAYLFVPFDQGHGWGYRYFHSVWGACPLLGVVPLLSPSPSFDRVRRAVVVASLGSLLLATPLRLAQVRTFIDAQLSQIPPTPPSKKRQLIFVHRDRGYYSQDLVQNDPFLRGPRVMLFSAGDAADADLAHSLDPPLKLSARNAVASVWVDP